MNGGLPDIQASGVCFIFLVIPVGEGQVIIILLVRIADNLNVNIVKIVHTDYFHVPIFRLL